jgi:hypothetical protein
MTKRQQTSRLPIFEEPAYDAIKNVRSGEKITCPSDRLQPSNTVSNTEFAVYFYMYQLFLFIWMDDNCQKQGADWHRKI